MESNAGPRLARIQKYICFLPPASERDFITNRLSLWVLICYNLNIRLVINMFERLKALIDEIQFEKIQRTKILLVGLGGVGGYTLESLVRSGFKHLTLVDGDIIAESNLNRQIIAKNDNLGHTKVEEAKLRALSINKDINIKTIATFLTQSNFKEYINDKYDYIIDACDDIKIKIELIKYAQDKNIKIITCLGTGKKLNPTKLEVTTLNKTFNDPLAKKLRYELRKQNISLKIPVVFSSEEVLNTNTTIGSAIFVPSCAGILLANYIFMDIINQ